MTAPAELFVVGPRDHVVYFYERDDELLAPVVSYVTESLDHAAAVVVIATETHLRGIRTLLARSGIDLTVAEGEGRFMALDADQTLSQFMRSDGPDAPRFAEVIGDVIRTAAAGGRPVRAYGEMVDVLWQRGDIASAIAVESHWNDLGAVLPFSLFCAYRLTDTADAAAVASVCDQHLAVLPSRPAARRAGAAEETRRFEPDTPGPARRFVAETLRRWQDDDLLEDAAIVVTELAANAIRHAATGFTVSVSDLGDRVRVSVADDSAALPIRREMDTWASSGRGITLVHSVACAWGVDVLGAGKAVWAELVRRAPRRNGQGSVRAGEREGAPAGMQSGNVLEAARGRLGVGLQDLWLAYFGLGGTASQRQVEAYLRGDAPLDGSQHDVLAQAINDRAIDQSENAPAPYADQIKGAPPSGSA